MQSSRNQSIHQLTLLFQTDTVIKPGVRLAQVGRVRALRARQQTASISAPSCQIWQSMYVYISYTVYPMISHFNRLIGWSVCHNFLKKSKYFYDPIGALFTEFIAVDWLLFCIGS